MLWTITTFLLATGDPVDAVPVTDSDRGANGWGYQNLYRQKMELFGFTTAFGWKFGRCWLVFSIFQ